MCRLDPNPVAKLPQAREFSTQLCKVWLAGNLGENIIVIVRIAVGISLDCRNRKSDALRIEIGEVRRIIFRSCHFECDPRPAVPSNLYGTDLHSNISASQSRPRNKQADEPEKKRDIAHLILLFAADLGFETYGMS